MVRPLRPKLQSFRLQNMASQRQPTWISTWPSTSCWSRFRNRVGEITNPVGFTSTHLLTVLGIKDAGNNYQDIHDWLQRMTLTGINSKGMVYMARPRTWVSDTSLVVARVVTMGSMLPDGAVDRKSTRLNSSHL